MEKRFDGFRCIDEIDWRHEWEGQMSIGEKLREGRLAAGFTQEAVAEKVGVSRQTVSNWETGKSYPDIVSVIALSDLYGVPLDVLLKGDPTMMQHLKESTDEPVGYGVLIRFVLLAGLFYAASTIVSVAVPLTEMHRAIPRMLLYIAMLLAFYWHHLPGLQKLSKQETTKKGYVKWGLLGAHFLIYLAVVMFLIEALPWALWVESDGGRKLIRVIVGAVLAPSPFLVIKKNFPDLFFRSRT